MMIFPVVVWVMAAWSLVRLAAVLIVPIRQQARKHGEHRYRERLRNDDTH